MFYSDTIFNGKKAANQYSDEKAVDVKKVLFFLRGISLTEIGRNTRTVAKYTYNRGDTNNKWGRKVCQREYKYTLG